VDIIRCWRGGGGGTHVRRGEIVKRRRPITVDVAVGVWQRPVDWRLWGWFFVVEAPRSVRADPAAGRGRRATGARRQRGLHRSDGRQRPARVQTSSRAPAPPRA